MLQITFKLTSDNNNSTLFMKILKMPEKWRDIGTIYINENKGIEICSYMQPELCLEAEIDEDEMLDNPPNVVFLKGAERNCDKNLVTYTTSRSRHTRLACILKDIIYTLCEATNDFEPNNAFVPVRPLPFGWRQTFTWNIKSLDKKSHPLTSIFKSV